MIPYSPVLESFTDKHVLIGSSKLWFVLPRGGHGVHGIPVASGGCGGLNSKRLTCFVCLPERSCLAVDVEVCNMKKEENNEEDTTTQEKEDMEAGPGDRCV